MDENQKKALVFEIVEIVRSEINKRVMIYSSVIGLVLAFFSFIGIQSIKDSFLSSEYTRKIKSDVSIELKGSLRNLDEKLDKLDDLQEKYHKLLADYQVKADELKKLYLLTEKLSVNYDLINSVVSDKIISGIRSNKEYYVLRAFGISPLTFIKIMLSESDLKLNDLNRGRYEKSIRFIQHQYGLSIDGKVGPCTALIFAQLSLDVRESDKEYGLHGAVFHENPELVYIISACTKDDKRALRWIMEKEELHNKNLKLAIDGLGLDITQVIGLLNSDQVEPQAYSSVRKIKKLMRQNQKTEKVYPTQ